MFYFACLGLGVVSYKLFGRFAPAILRVCGLILVLAIVINAASADERPTLSPLHYPVYRDSILFAKCVESGHLPRAEFNRMYDQVRRVDPMATMVTQSGEPAVRQYLGPMQYARLLADSRDFARLSRADADQQCRAIRERNF